MVPNTLFDGVANEKPMNKVPFRISPMLATLADAPFSRPNWIYEEKYDGVRILAYKEGPRVSLISRNAIDRTSRYPEIAAAVAKLKARTLALDGEVVVFDAKNVSRFQLLQQGKGRQQYAVFDILYANGCGLAKKSLLSVRRDALERWVQPSSSLLLSARLAARRVKSLSNRSRGEGLRESSPRTCLLPTWRADRRNGSK